MSSAGAKQGEASSSAGADEERRYVALELSLYLAEAIITEGCETDCRKGHFDRDKQKERAPADKLKALLSSQRVIRSHDYRAKTAICAWLW